jgi:N-acetylmuramoyl-L-alanine amidase
VALCPIALLAWSGVARASAPLVLLDPGHTQSHPGALSARAIPEVAYNDAFVAVLASGLERAGFRVATTRRPGEEVDLDARARTANAQQAWLLISIHHDSAQLQFLEKLDRDGKAVHRTVKPIRGYSLFVSGTNPRFSESMQAAKALGRRLLALGRPPTLHHAEPIPGEGRPLLDPVLGVYRYDDLKILKAVTCPAVLLEVGVLVDETDEAYVADPEHRGAVVDAVVSAVQDLRRTSTAPRSSDLLRAPEPTPTNSR